MRWRLSHFDIRAILSERTKKTLKESPRQTSRKKKKRRREDSEKLLKMALEKVHETLQIKINVTL